MELGTIEEVELIVDQIASNQIPPPNKAQSLVIIRQMMRMAKQIESQAAEIERLSALCDKWNFECDDMREDNERLSYVAGEYKSLCDQLGAALEDIDRADYERDFLTSAEFMPLEKALAAWRASK